MAMQLNDFVKITEEPIDLNAIVALVTDPKAGSVSTFLGITRDNFNGKKVLRLEYEAYEPMAVKELNTIAAKIREKWNVIHIALYHRTGLVPISESSVVIAISSEHREESLQAVHWAIDELKATVPIWKKEYYEDGSVWKGNAECKHGHHAKK